MTIKGFTEHRGTASRMTFDHKTGQFSQTPVPHPFLARLEAKVEAEDCAVINRNPKNKRPQRSNLKVLAH